MKQMKKWIMAVVLLMSVCLLLPETQVQATTTKSDEVQSDGASVRTKNKEVDEYTYTITPLLKPFNDYFFVKTDNPDPNSFRFVDESTKYLDSGSEIILATDVFNGEVCIYEDIKYENQQTGRVNGGYIFRGNGTDGGEIILQMGKELDYGWGYTDYEWSDTKLKYKLPVLKDDADYLIDTYAVKSDFFENMDAVQQGLSSICLYSGSKVRGKLTKVEPFWSLSSSPHRDQIFYIQSPYEREDNKKLFATDIYPYRYDSLGFPSMMATVAKRLDSSVSVKWNSYSHAFIDVTYNGKTKLYGGQGNGEGQGISKDKIKQYFTFGTNGTKFTLEGIRNLLDEYAKIEMQDDVPRKDALTWESVCNTVGNGTWVSLLDLGSMSGDTGYSYLYKKNDGTNHWTDTARDNGSELYWSGDLGYAADVWIDGRYVNAWEVFALGETFEQHPTSSIALRNVKIPKITYEYAYDYLTGAYEPTNVTVLEEEQPLVYYDYSKEEDMWLAEGASYDEKESLRYKELVHFVENGLLEQKYLDMLTLTLEEVKALQVDKNTNVLPENFLIYDGSAEPGTPFVPVTKLALNKRSVTLQTGKSTLLTATVNPKNATDKSVHWSSSNSEVATVDASGKVTAIKRGKVKITAKAGNKSATCNVEVIVAPINAAKVTLSQSNFLYNGKTKKPSVTVKLGQKTLTYGTDYSVSYKNNQNIGTATITIKGKGNYTGTITKTFTIKAKIGSTFTSGSYRYKVTETSSVAFNGIVSAKTTNVTIPRTVTYGGKTFKVSSIADKALKGKTNVTKISIGANVTKIGTSAFESCKNLKSITIASTNVKTVGKNAFKNINAKASVKVPKSKSATYKKLLKNAGAGNTVKFVSET